MKKVNLITILYLSFIFSIQAQRWEAQNTNLNGKFPMYLSVIDNQKAWIMSWQGNFAVSPWLFSAQSTGYLSRTIDGGKTWVSKNINFATALGPTNLYVQSIDTLYAAYSTLSSNYLGYLYKTVDGGQSWSSKFSGQFINAIHFFDSQNGILITDPDPLKYGIYVSSDAGETWNLVSNFKTPTPLAREYLINYSKSTYANTIIMATTAGRVWRSKDRGQSWEIFTVPLPATNLYYSNLDSKGNVLLAGGNYTDSLNFKGNFYYSPDTGRTWSLQSSTPFIATAVQYVPQTNFVIASVRNNNSPTKGSFKLILSDDNMKTWRVIDTSLRLYALGMINAQTGWATEYQNDDNQTLVYRYIGSPLSGLWNTNTLKGELKVSPNPAHTEGVNIDISNFPNDDYRLLINNISGQLIYSQNLHLQSSQKLYISTSNWSNGIHILTLTSAQGSISQKIIKQ